MVGKGEKTVQAVLCKTCGKNPVIGYNSEGVLVSWGILAFVLRVFSNDACSSCASDERLKEIKENFNHDNRLPGWLHSNRHNRIRPDRSSTWIITAKRRGTATDYTVYWGGYFDASVERRERLAQYMEELGILSRESSGNWQVVDERRGIIVNPGVSSTRLYFTEMRYVSDFVRAYNEDSLGNTARAQKLA